MYMTIIDNEIITANVLFSQIEDVNFSHLENALPLYVF